MLLIPTAVYIPVIYFFFPETMNRSLEDINAQFGDDVAVHYFGATEAEEMEYATAIEKDEVIDPVSHQTAGNEDKTGVEMIEAISKA